ncbi:P-selectin [Merluccius polli]|uniref:E-selectin n=1 Tax=Merluccius polli TaxID=89951 RepID=A0AA47P414_MERPO|nr:P-selectin [Merluccius polli]
MSVLLFGVVPHSKYCFVKKVIFVLQKSSFPSNASGSKLSTSWMIYFQLMLCMWTGGVAGWSYFYSNTTMDWRSARQWCRDHYTDMVAIQNQQEIAHLNSWLPRQPTYYWIGIRKVDNVWTWVGTNKSLTDQATNWATGEPNNKGQVNGINEDCVEMYIKRESQAGKWNDEKCVKSKTALCYAAACKNDSCVQGECVETINSHKCQCSEGFYGDKCEHVVQCDSDEVVAPAKANVSCSHTHGAYAYGTLCDFSCEEGHGLSHPEPMRCTAAGSWSMAPTCEPVQCPVLPETDNMAVRCEGDTGGRFSYGSSCTFTCSRGYSLRGAHTTTCTATAAWSEAVPSCERVTCPMPQGDGRTTAHCSGPLDALQPGSTCSFTCEPGFEVQWAPVIACTEEGSWNASVPTCRVVTCDQGPAPEAHSIVRCSDTHGSVEYGAVCEYACEEGYHISDPSQNAVQCTAAGTWSRPPAVCERSAVQCSPPVAPESGQINCQPPLSVTASPSSYPQGSACTFTCNEGYEHQGPLTIECTQSGQWSSPPPTCTVVHCEELSRPGHGTLECQHPLGDWSFMSSCVFSCEEGYDMPQSRSDTLLCGASGHWNDSVPICAAVQCPVLPETDNMAVRCEGDTGGRFSYGSSCTFTCSWGYSLRGAHTTTCTATAAWSEAVPSCERVTCPMPQGDGRTTAHCSGPLDALQPGSTCSFTCEPGFEVQWAPVIACTEEGSWNASVPTCRVVTCDQGPAPEAHSIVRCSDTHGSVEYGAVCEYACEEGYHISDPSQNAVQCTAAGTWSRPPAVCERSAVQCSPPVAPESGQINCQPPLSVTASPSSYPQGSACTFTCNEGYEHQGPLTTECTQSGQWSSPPPTCTAMGCPVLDAPVDGTLNCTDSDQTHASQCSFACDQGFTLRGHRVVTCGLHGNWTAETPVCQAVPPSSHTEMVLAAGGAVSLSALSLAVWLMKRLRKVKERKFSLASNSDAEDPPQHYKNSIDGLI